MTTMSGMRITRLKLLAMLVLAGNPAAVVQADTSYAWANFAGQPGFENSGSLDGTNSAAQFYYPSSVALDTNGNLFVADNYNHTIRKVTPAGLVTTIAGTAEVYGSDDGTNSASRFYYPSGVALDTDGNLFVADSWNYTIRKVSPVGTNWVVTTIAGSAGNSGSADGTNSAAGFNVPSCVAVDPNGNVFVADTNNNAIRKITPAGADWVVTTIAGKSGALYFGSADGTNSAARFYQPFGVALDTNGNLFVADTYNHTIRKITPTGADWVVTTIAGTAEVYGSADGTNSAAGFDLPFGIAVDTIGIVVVADTYNHTIRKITPTGADWVVTTIGGSAGNPGSANGTNNAAGFNLPSSVVVAPNGTVFVADSGNNRVSKGSPFLSGLTITTDGSLTAGTVGTAYNTTLAATGGAEPFNWSLLTGGLPDGLILSTNTGVISGTPTTAGMSNFTVRCTDTNSVTADKAFSLTINPALTAWQVWQFQYFGCTNCSNAAPDADPLGKGMSNTNQFLAGLNPTNAASVFRITSAVRTGANFVVTWRAVGGKSYVVQTNAVPGSGYADGCPPIVVPGSSETVTNWTDTGGATNRPARFYRVRLIQP
jgi:sugar lactone lactonase YvrE